MAIHKINSVDIPNLDKSKNFVVDTNILYFIHSGYYAPLSNSIKNKYTEYSSFIAKLITNGNTLYTTTANIQELFHCIENKEYLIYCNINSLNKKTFTKKDFRSISTERSKVRNKLKIVLTEIISAYGFVDVHIQTSCVEKFVNEYTQHRYNPIDYIIVNDSIGKQQLSFISDDSDFTYDSRVDVYTV